MTRNQTISKYTAYAASCIASGQTNRRSFDNCFENGKEIADAVVIKLVHKALSPPPYAETVIGKSYAMDGEEYKAIKRYRNWEQFSRRMKEDKWLENWMPFYEANKSA